MMQRYFHDGNILSEFVTEFEHSRFAKCYRGDDRIFARIVFTVAVPGYAVITIAI